MDDDRPLWPRPRYSLTWGCEQAPMVQGARWWNESLDSGSLLSKRNALKAIVYGGGTLATILVLRACLEDDDPADAVSRPSVEVQRQYGWHFGSDSSALSLSAATDMDVSSSTTGWQHRLEGPSLASTLCPGEGRWRAFCQTTLLRAPHDDASGTLKAALKPIVTAEMLRAYRLGLGVKALREALGAPAETAWVVDLPGPWSVALAAAMADVCEPVFLFDNWPHPRGAVPAHETLAAALYYAPRFEEKAEQRRARQEAPAPVFVLDDRRLSSTTNGASEENVFDNRYVVTMPTAEALRERGVRRVLYLRDRATDLPELDDLNELLVAYEEAGLIVRALTFDEFAAPSDGASGPDADPGEPDALVWQGDRTAAASCWQTLGIPVTKASAEVARYLSSVTDAERLMFAYRPARRATMFTAPPTRVEGVERAAVASGPLGQTVIYLDRQTGGIVHSPRFGSWHRASSFSSG